MPAGPHSCLVCRARLPRAAGAKDPNVEVRQYHSCRFVGVDTHADTHHAAVIYALCAHPSDQVFPTMSGGYGALCQWASS